MGSERSIYGLVWSEMGGIFICRPCAQGLRYTNIKAHFDLRHGYSDNQRAELQAFVDEINVALTHNTENEMQIPLVLDTPIPYLAIYKDLLYCRREPSHCHYVCSQEKNMKDHCRIKHRWTEFKRRGRPTGSSVRIRAGKPWIRTDAQRIYESGYKSCYIPLRMVEPASPVSTAPDFWDMLSQQVDELHHTQEQQISREGPRSTNLWVMRTGWARHLADYDRARLCDLIVFPSKDEPEWFIMQAISLLIRTSQEQVRTDAGIFIRLALVQISPEHYRHQPLQPYLEDQDLTRNLKYWQYIILFFIRTKQNPSHAPAYTLDQRQKIVLESIEDAAIDLQAGNQNQSSGSGSPSLEDNLLELIISLLDYKSKMHEYDSPLYHAIAILGIPASDPRGWKTPQQFPSIISGIVKIARFLVFRYACRIYSQQANNTSTSILLTVQDMVRRFMLRGTQSPVDALLALRAFGMKIAYSTTSDAKVLWNGELVMYGSIQFTLDQFRHAVNSLISKARTILDEKLLFREHRTIPLPIIPWDELRDDHSNEDVGWNFLKDVRCRLPVDGKSWLADIVRTSTELDFQFLSRRGSNIVIRPVRVHSYLENLAQFKLLLALLIHLSAQPARVPELLSIRHQNSTEGEPRGILIDNGMVAIVTRYYKASHYRGDTRIIYRYLPRMVGNLLIYYLWLVLPWVEMIATAVNRDIHLSSLLWPTEEVSGRAVTASRFRTMFPLLFQEHLGQEINVSAYRHLAISMARQFNLPSPKTWESPDEDGPYDAELDGDNIWDLQAGHSTYIANVIYGRDPEQRPGDQVSQRQQFRAISKAWHEFLGINNTVASGFDARPTILNIVRTSPPNHRGNLEQQSLEQTLQTRWQAYKDANIYQQLRLLYGANAHLRLNQRDVLKSIHQGITPILSIMPTGGGKSLLFTLPASYEFSQVTVVVVPFIALRQDAVRQSRGLRVASYSWDSSKDIPNSCRLLFVTPESAVSEEFLINLHRLRTMGRLDRIVLDECHLLLAKDASFRPAFQHLWQLVQVGVPLLCLSATLPPTCEDEFWTTLRLQHTTKYVYRSATRRPELQYTVLSISQSKKTTYITESIEKSRLKGKTVIYCPSVRIVDDIARTLHALRYHARYEDKDQALRRFVDEPNSVIVSTCALGVGIHIEGIQTIIHYAAPDSLLDYAQECGRGGRNGSQSECILLESDHSDQGKSKRSKRRDRWMQEYITPSTRYQCRRQVLAFYLDGDRASPVCDTAAREVLCDLCDKAKSNEEQQRSLERIEDFGEVFISRIEPTRIYPQAKAQPLQDSAQTTTAKRRFSAKEVVEQQSGTAVKAATISQSLTTIKNRVQPILKPSYTTSETMVRESQESIRITTKQHASGVDQLVSWLAAHHKACLLCIGSNDVHDYDSCTDRDRAAYTQMREWLKKSIQFDRFAACWGCGYPQRLCRTWIPNDKGLRKRDDIECEFPWVIYEAATMFLFKPDSSRASAFYRRLGTTAENQDIVKQEVLDHLKRKIRWSGIEASRLFQEVFYWYIDDGSLRSYN